MAKDTMPRPWFLDLVPLIVVLLAVAHVLALNTISSSIIYKLVNWLPPRLCFCVSKCNIFVDFLVVILSSLLIQELTNTEQIVKFEAKSSAVVKRYFCISIFPA
uniref:Uncharacterized protein n=1 Tax=Salix viminalis TaxID=40686 RepID=A0A6N2KCQ5_SALVM